MTVSKTNLIKMFVTASFMFGGLIAVGQTQTFAKSNKITSNVSMAKVNSDDRNVTLTGKHQNLYKSSVIEGGEAGNNQAAASKACEISSIKRYLLCLSDGND